jgi:membrane associated rhomboid family serine protease
MFFPIHDRNPRRRKPVITLLLIASMVLVWLVVQAAGTGFAMAHSVCDLGMIPGELTGRAIGAVVPLDDRYACVVDPSPAWYTVVTSMFLHGGWLHLIGNLWFLWLFGDNVEDAFGHVGYAVFYVACGVVAAATQLAIHPASPVPMVGASGAISGVMGAYVVLFPHVPVRVLVVLIIFLTTVTVPAVLMLGLWFALQLISGLPQLTGGAETEVAFWAHVGGFVAGVVVALAMRKHVRSRLGSPPRPRQFAVTRSRRLHW